MRQREDGYCMATAKQVDVGFLLPRSVFAALKRDWMAGKAFFEAPGYYGGEQTIRLADIANVADIPPEAVQARMADDRESEREDAIPT